MENCVFCQIIKGVAPASIVYSDKSVIALLDVQPVNPGHLLVIPKIHAAQLSDLDEKIGAHLFRLAMRVAGALRQSGVRCEGVNLFLADGEEAFQDVFHVHLHVIPRFKGDGFRIKCGRGYGFKPARNELDDIALKIKEAMH